MSKREIKVSDRYIGDGHPCFVIGEIGINHNGSVDIAKKIIDGAKSVGCDAVKFQKRTPEICTPKDQWYIERDTPWGRMTYIDYRYKVEFGIDQYSEIDKYCKEIGIIWFASCWDEEAVDFIEQFNPPLYKTASASLTDHDLLVKHKNLKKPLIISTGMSTIKEIEDAIVVFGVEDLLIAHSTSSY
ncbi:MAG TPA: N-acetylneuraminate synthase family protein, partial [Ignavibacteriaceae bacterium]|nr:N-acetylneuraminate synthase family protein [Ignavibacteriaceae bacterium]